MFEVLSAGLEASPGTWTSFAGVLDEKKIIIKNFDLDLDPTESVFIKSLNPDPDPDAVNSEIGP